LTKISLFWFQKLGDIIPNHFVTANIDEMPEEIRKYKDQLDCRAMLVRKAEVVPLEAIVRGYLAGTLPISLHHRCSVFLICTKALHGRNTRKVALFMA
jgi:phosphoribosylaminoimidazole-succinocarboxamide synthase